MIEIEFKDLCVFEQLLKEKLERLSKGLVMTKRAKGSHLYRNFFTDFTLYSSLYEEICDKILASDFSKNCNHD